MDKILAIGDIHGCMAQLQEILDAAEGYPEHRLVFLGDYIDRGLEAEAVCRRLMRADGVFLKGNHEEMLLSRLEMDGSKRDYLLATARIGEESLEWIRTALVDRYETDDYIFVHAGLDAKKPLAEQTERDYLWSIHDGDYSGLTDKLVVHGHLAVPAVERVGNRININTGCGSGGRLTALVLPEMATIVSSVSPGSESNLAELRRELEEAIEELDTLD